MRLSVILRLMIKMDYDVFDIVSGKFVGRETMDRFKDDLQICQAEYDIVKAILEHHLHSDERESGDLQ